MKNFQWLIRREFWENRSIWLVPAVIGAVLVFGAVFGHVHFGEDFFRPDGNRGGIPAHFTLYVLTAAVGASFLIVASLTASWYLLDCLYADRKDRSILFWKSLPVSDTETVLSKLAIGLLVLPLVYLLIADLTIFLMSFVLSLRVGVWGDSGLWRADIWLQTQGMALYLIATMAIWYLPIAAWFLLVSAWASRAVILWSILPPLAIYLMERYFFGTHLFGSWLAERSGTGYAMRAFHLPGDGSAWVSTTLQNGPGTETMTTPTSLWAVMDFGGFFGSWATWAGVAIGVAMIVATIQIRARRSEI
jgi:ABC-2 type transport system permease protein